MPGRPRCCCFSYKPPGVYFDVHPNQPFLSFCISNHHFPCPLNAHFQSEITLQSMPIRNQLQMRTMKHLHPSLFLNFLYR